MILVSTVILVALVFTYTNGFHDTANSIATVVGTKVLTPRQAILLATVTNLLGAMTGAAVAQTIASGLVDTTGLFIPPAASSEMLICALLAAIAWNLVTWYFGLPSSSSHALVGGLCGAALAAAHGNWHAVVWSKLPAAGHHWWTGGGVLYKVVIPMILSPLLGIRHCLRSDVRALPFPAKLAAAKGHTHFRAAPTVQFGLHGLQPRHQ